MKTFLRTALIAAAAAGLLLGCSSKDPRQQVLEERLRWEITPLNWAQSPDDGSIGLSLRVGGPVHSELSRFTVRVQLKAEDGSIVLEEWRPLDVSGLQRGVPTDMLLHFAPREETIAELILDPVYDPEPEEAGHIVELPR